MVQTGRDLPRLSARRRPTQRSIATIWAWASPESWRAAGAFPVQRQPAEDRCGGQAGGQSQLCGLAAAALVAALAVFGTGLLAGAPTAALAGVLLFVAQRIFRLKVLAG